MTNNDLKQIGTLIDEKLASSENRMLSEIGNSEKRLLSEIGKFVDDQLLPAIESKADKTDIDRLERKFDTTTGKLLDLEKVIDEVKSVPVIAHQLKIKKSS
jgi:hypothetical protein